MHDPHANPSTELNAPTKALLESLQLHPELVPRFQATIDILDRAPGEGLTADQAEQRVIEAIRQLSNELLTTWSQQTADHAARAVSAQHRQAIKSAKKK